ncbi:uncharacterized protein LOC122260749 [Penaeus japonicus]|uniref:uncharacterized protein LOC122260749 n=1 Tax=Penaeus japonicus TaxID=27405 RepID=UPI001C714333|nr:uncharacterized protein LOC122260749 [Penaeus japonicus]
MGRVLSLYWLIFQCLIYSEEAALTAVERSLGAPEVNVTIINKLYIRVTWKREGPWSNEREFIVDFKAVGARPTSKPCNDQRIPCNSDICSVDSNERCPSFGVCRDVGVFITANGYSTRRKVRTDAYTPASVRVDSNGGTLEVSWKGPANKDGDCYAGSVLTISTPWTQYNTSYTEILGQYQHSHSLTACDVGSVTTSLESFDLMGNRNTVTNSTEYSGENASPVIDDLKLIPGRRSVFATWDLLGKCTKVTSYSLAWTPPDAGGEMSVPDTSANITGLLPCQEYLLTVQPLVGKDDLGGLRSEEIYTEHEAPQEPTNVKVLTVEDKSDHLDVTWTQPSPPGPLCPITNNSISWSRVDTAGEAGEAEIVASSSYTITGLDPCAQYSVIVRADNEKGYGDQNEGNVGTTGAVVPSAPTSVEVLTVDEEPGQLDVTWTQPSPPGPLCPITNNSISWSRVDTAGEAGEAEIVASSTYTITGLDPCAQYHVVIRAANEKGYGVQYGDFGNTGAIAPEAPSNITVLMVEDESEHLDVTWTQPAPPGPLCPITRNSVRWSLNDTGDTVGKDEITASTEYSITGLKAYTTYVVHVASETDGGFGQEIAANNTTDQDIPGSPIIASLNVSTPSSMLVKWEPPPQPNGVITGYKVEWKYENQEHSMYLNSSQAEYEIRNLTACVLHEITIMAETIKGFGEGNVSDTSMAVAPEAPEDVTADRVPNISDQLKVTWTQPKPYGKCTITNNKVTWLWQHKGQTEQNETVVSATSSHTISGLKPYTNYTVCVAAQTEGGYGPNGNCHSAVTEEDVPGPPVVTQVEQSAGTIRLVWEHPVDPRGQLLLYNLSWMNTEESSDSGRHTLPSNQTSYTITGLQSNSQYNISLMAKTSAGWGTVLADTVETTQTPGGVTLVVWLTIVFVIAAPLMVGLFIGLSRQRRNSGFLLNKNDDQDGKIHATDLYSRNGSYAYDNQDPEDMTDYDAPESGETSPNLTAHERHTEVLKLSLDVLNLLRECEGVDVNKPSALNKNNPSHTHLSHTNVAELLLMKCADSKSETPTQHTPLHYAALRGYATLVKLLIFYGADPNVRDERNNTPLHYAALSGHTSVVELLVNERADLSIRTDLGLSVLHKASFYGRLSTVQKLVELQDTLVSIRDEENLRAEDTALIRGHVHTAWWLNKNASEVSLQDQTHLKNICMSKYSQCGEFYHTYCEDKNTKSTALATAIDFGVCDLHYQDERGRTLLHVAAEQNDRRKIRVLLERGALPTARTHDGETPADLARQKGHLEAAEIILAKAKNKETGHKKNILYTHLLNLITTTSKANLQGDDEEQATRLAAVKEASSLLASGAPLEPPGGHSYYPLHHAITANCTPLLPLLLAAGAPLTSSVDAFGPIQMAWMTPDATPWVGVVVTRVLIHKILLEIKLLDPELKVSAETLVKSLEGDKPWDAKVSVLGDSPNTQDSLLFRACAAGATTFAWWIWHSGGSAVSQNKKGETPLHAALDAGHLDTATALVLHMGANLFLPDHKGRAPVDLIPDDATKEHLLTASLARECRRLADEWEKSQEPTRKQEARQIVFLFLSLHCAYASQTDEDHDTLCWKTIFWWLNKELCEGDDWMEKLILVTKTQDTKVSEDKESGSSFIDVTCDDMLELITKSQFRYAVSSAKMGDGENDMVMNTLGKILEKAIILSCEREFPLFLHFLVHVGKQKVTSEIEVCQASLLHYAALKNNISAARYLVSHGASIKAKDRFGNTPAHYACMHGYKESGDFLRTYQVNRYGLTAMDLLDGYRNYLKLYDLDLKSLANIDIQKNNTAPQRINILLKELKKKWQVNGIGEAIAKVHVNYSRGESKDIQAAVFSWADSIKNAVAKKNPMFSGELLMLGSSADNVRLFCPDEYDCNIILSSFNGYPNGGLQVSLEEKEPDYSDCKSKINVSSKHINILNLLKGNNFLYTFYSMVKECISILEPEDKRLTMIPPGVKRTKVGVGLTLVWTGKEFPLLLVDVDIVPTMEAPWPADLPRPPLTPPHIKSVYINSIGNGEWRFSFAQAENEIMKNLTPNQRRVFLACKMVLSSLKVEKWAPRDIQSRFKYFEKIFFKIPSPKSFILKNTFFLELQDFRSQTSYWTDQLEKRVRSIFERMCEKGVKEPAKIEAYFAGSTEASSLGYGASEIVHFFTPKPGFHGVSEY